MTTGLAFVSRACFLNAVLCGYSAINLLAGAFGSAIRSPVHTVVLPCQASSVAPLLYPDQQVEKNNSSLISATTQYLGHFHRLSTSTPSWHYICTQHRFLSPPTTSSSSDSGSPDQYFSHSASPSR
ncbi:hypothetical protein DL96DRAFT_1263603 [Flagelloscypha sp. PMI_526]|nr:hypothetical protein DL96DRAFT_1263603 [Flagelloscypha sp. PMI_526]